jgi:hypothetical protein
LGGGQAILSSTSHDQNRAFGVANDTRGIWAKQEIGHRRAMGADDDEVGFHFLGRFKDTRIDVSPAEVNGGFVLFGNILVNESIHHLGEFFDEFFRTVIRKVQLGHRVGYSREDMDQVKGGIESAAHD